MTLFILSGADRLWGNEGAHVMIVMPIIIQNRDFVIKNIIAITAGFS